jgi:hypothetical protein
LALSVLPFFLSGVEKAAVDKIMMAFFGWCALGFGLAAIWRQEFWLPIYFVRVRIRGWLAGVYGFLLSAGGVLFLVISYTSAIVSFLATHK